MDFNEVLSRLSGISDTFGDFDVTYFSLDAAKGEEILSLSDDGFGDFNNNHHPFNNIDVEHEVSHTKTEEIETIGDLKKVLEQFDDDLEVSTLCLYADDGNFAKALHKRITVNEKENKICHEKKYKI